MYRSIIAQSLAAAFCTPLIVGAPMARATVSFPLLVASGQTIYQVTPAGVVTPFANMGANHGANALAFDSNGNLFVAESDYHQIVKISPNGTQSIFAATTPDFYPSGLAFDSSGNLYTSNYGGGSTRIEKITPDGTVSPYATKPVNTQNLGIAIDGSGNLYTADFDTNKDQITKIDNSGTASLFAALPDGSDVNCLNFDPNGNLFVTLLGNGNITKITPDGATSIFLKWPGDPAELTFDANGNLYVDDLANKIGVISPDGLTVTTLVPFIQSPYVMTFFPAAPVPEPASLFLLVLGSAGLLRRKPSGALNTSQIAPRPSCPNPRP